MSMIKIFRFCRRSFCESKLSLSVLIIACLSCVASFKTFAEIAAEVIGDTVRVVVDPGTAEGAALRLVWGEKDFGEDVESWANGVDFEESIPAEGGTYQLSRAQLAIGKKSTLRVLAVTKDMYEILNCISLKQDGAYLDTGIKDNNCTGVELGASVQEGGSWNTAFFGSVNSGWNAKKGLTICKAGQNWQNWVIVVDGSIVGTGIGNGWAVKNDLIIRGGSVTLNGVTVGEQYTSNTIGNSGENIFLGRAFDTTSVIRQDWYYLKLYGTEGQLVRDYVPAKRKLDDTVGFFDNLDNSFSLSSGAESFVAGSKVIETKTVYSTLMSSASFTVPTTTLTIAGDMITVHVPAAVTDSAKVYLAWDEADCGENLADWQKYQMLDGDVTSAGGEFQASISALGIPDVASVRAFVIDGSYREVSLLTMSGEGAYVDTGIKDSSCSGVEFGAAIKEGGSWNTAIFGSVYSGWNEKKGLTICKAGQSWQNWVIVVDGINLGATSTGYGWAKQNDLSIRNGVVTFNGTIVASELTTSALGTSGKTIHIGRAANDTEAIIEQDWYYMRLYGIDGALMVDYRPAKSIEDGTAGFFDVVNREFHPASGGSGFVAGEELEQVYFVCKDTSVAMPVNAAAVVEAEWIGKDDNLENAANWLCRNSAGELVEGAVPGNKAVVRMAGRIPSSFDGSQNYAGVVFGDAVLTADCPLQKFSRVGIEGTLNLTGHVLSATGLSGDGRIESFEAGGELHLMIAEGKTEEIALVELAGFLKVVKSGAGELIFAKDGQSFEGGVEIVEGKVRGNAPGASVGTRFGKEGNIITVDEAGTLDVYQDEGGFSAYEIVLAGGTLMNSLGQQNALKRNFSVIRLTADSYLAYDVSLALTGDAKGYLEVDLGGHCLTVNGYTSWGMLDVKYMNLKNGELFVKTRRLRVGLENGDWLNADEATIRIGAQAYVDLLGGINGGNVICETTTKNWESEWQNAIYVSGLFVPITDRGNGIVKLLNGATLDCSARADAVVAPLRFDDGAVIKVVSGKKKTGAHLMAWTEETIPANLSTLKFQLIGEPAEAGRRVEIKEDGLYLSAVKFFVSVR